MKLEDLTRLMQQGESETIEFKRSTGEHDAAAVTACAMLNQRGGRLSMA